MLKASGAVTRNASLVPMPCTTRAEMLDAVMLRGGMAKAAGPVEQDLVAGGIAPDGEGVPATDAVVDEGVIDGTRRRLAKVSVPSRSTLV